MRYTNRRIYLLYFLLRS